MKKIIKEYFHYTQTEKRGALFLIGLLLVVLSFYAFDYQQPSNEFYSEELSVQTEEFFCEQKEEQEVEGVDAKEVSLQVFNPNLLSKAEWVELGFSEKQAQTILNYKNKIGGFKKKEDLKKLYVMSDAMYSRLEPYVAIPKDVRQVEKQIMVNRTFENRVIVPKQPLEFKPIELNGADTSQLKLLKGVGSFYSRRIIKYRDLLGGFVSSSQLSEVYGLKPEVLDNNIDRIRVDTLLVRKININTATVGQLKSHPYINWNMANSIVQIRESHGNYESLQGIKKSDLVNDELYRKIAPYLEIGGRE